MCLSNGKKNYKVKLSTFHSWTQIDFWKRDELVFIPGSLDQKNQCYAQCPKMETKTDVKNRQSRRSQEQTKLDKKILIKNK